MTNQKSKDLETHHIRQQSANYGRFSLDERRAIVEHVKLTLPEIEKAERASTEMHDRKAQTFNDLRRLMNVEDSQRDWEEIRRAMAAFEDAQRADKESLAMLLQTIFGTCKSE